MTARDFGPSFPASVPKSPAIYYINFEKLPSVWSYFPSYAEIQGEGFVKLRETFKVIVLGQLYKCKVWMTEKIPWE